MPQTGKDVYPLVREGNFFYSVTATIAAGAATVTVALPERFASLVSCTPTTNQDQILKGAVLATDGKSVTITLLANATADNVFKVLLA